MSQGQLTNNKQKNVKIMNEKKTVEVNMEVFESVDKCYLIDKV